MLLHGRFRENLLQCSGGKRASERVPEAQVHDQHSVARVLDVSRRAIRETVSALAFDFLEQRQVRSTVAAQQVERVFVGSEAVGLVCRESSAPAVEDRCNGAVAHRGSGIEFDVRAGALQLRYESAHEVRFSVTRVSCEDEAEALAHFADEKVFERRLDVQPREVRDV